MSQNQLPNFSLGCPQAPYSVAKAARPLVKEPRPALNNTEPCGTLFCYNKFGGIMRNLNLERINLKKLELGENELVLKRTDYPEPIVKDGYLVDSNGERIGTKGDMYAKVMMDEIMQNGTMDMNPRPHYTDGEPAHTLSINGGGVMTYDLAKGESPLQTLRPIAVKSAIGELLWIYQQESNDLDLLAKYGVTWWDDWDIGNRTIGSVYGETVRRHELMKDLLEGLKNNPDGRRHIINLWQVDDFKEPHGLKPCAYLTTFNVRHEWDGKDYLDMSLKQRSSDFATAGCINQVQYVILQNLVARHLGIEPGRFTWQYDNIQLYDRHLDQAIEMMWRDPLNCDPKIVINPDKTNFYDMEVSDIKVEGYPRELIKTKNPQVKFLLGI